MMQPEDIPEEKPVHNASKSVDASVDSFVSVSLIVLTVILMIIPFGIVLTPATIYGAIRYHQSAKKKAATISAQNVISRNSGGTTSSQNTSAPVGINTPILAVILLILGVAAFMGILFNGLT